MIPVLVGIGSNLGERAARIRLALRRLGCEGRLRLRARSSLRESEPLGGPAQGRYVNGVAWLEVAMDPPELLARLQREERRQGRPAGGVRNGPRTLDLDILLYDSFEIRVAALQIPHPRMLDRPFVMEPALQITPRWVHPGRGLPLVELWGARPLPLGGGRCIP